MIPALPFVCFYIAQMLNLKVILFHFFFFPYFLKHMSSTLSINRSTDFPFLCALVAQSCSTLCNLTDCSPPGSSAHGILQARILEWVAISFSNSAILFFSFPRAHFFPLLGLLDSSLFLFQDCSIFSDGSVNVNNCVFC